MPQPVEPTDGAMPLPVVWMPHNVGREGHDGSGCLLDSGGVGIGLIETVKDILKLFFIPFFDVEAVGIFA